MKPSLSLHTLLCAALSLTLALAAPAASTADPATAATAPAPPPPPAGARLLSVQVLEQYAPARRAAIQKALGTIFYKDEAYAAAYRDTGAPLSDRIVGPITLSFISRFWLYYNIDPAPNMTDASVDIMLGFAERLRARPKWRADLVSARFGRWIDRQPDRVELYRIRLAVDPLLLPPVLKRYHDDTSEPKLVNPEDAPLSVYWYGLTQDDLTSISTQPAFTPALLAPLGELHDTVHDSAADLASTVRDILHEAGQSEQNITALLAQLLPLAKTDGGYIINEDVLAELAKTTALPAQLSAMFEDIVGMQYVHRSLFDQAMIQRLRIGLSNCQVLPSEQEQLRRKSRRITREDMAALRQTLDAGSNAAPGAVVDKPLGERLELLWGSSKCDKHDNNNDPLDELYQRYRNVIYAVVRKVPDYGKAQPFLLTSDMCGCNTDRLKDEVYHFLPFWLGGPPQRTDFSLMTRLNYYGLTFDNRGQLRMGNSGERIEDLFTGRNADQLAFITEARRHRVKVDWVVHRSGWVGWHHIDVQTRKQVLAHLALNIVSMLSRPLTDLRSKAIPWMTFGASGVPTRGDGVTLYFDGYPADATSVALYYEFIGQLRKLLTTGGHALNIMVRHKELNQGIYNYQQLSDMVESDHRPEQPALYEWAQHNLQQVFGGGPDQRGYVKPRYLVLLEEPILDTKKQLRSDIEDALLPKAQTALLRHIIPVINFNGVAWAQLEQDLVYFDDNFAGVGFWPSTKPPAPDAAQVAAEGVARCGDLQLLEDCIQDYFQYPPGKTESLACKFVCSYRLPLRFALDLLVLALGATALIYWRWCDARPVVRKYYLAPVAALATVLIIFASLMTCDPYLNNLGDGLLVPGVLVAALIVMYCYFRSLLKERDARP